MGKQHIIELNGKRYDAVTGMLITDKLTSENPINIPKQVKSKKLDGFSVPSQKTKKSQTLMRQFVHKPKPAKPQPEEAPFKATKQIQVSKHIAPERLARAAVVPKNSLIKKFGNPGPANNEITAKHVAKPAQIASALNVAIAATVKMSPIEQGLARATSHEQTKLRRDRAHARLARRLKVSPRLLSGGSLALAAVLIAGFFAYQNIPNLNMRLASARSGVQGSLPGYQPAGFGYKGSIRYKPGQITVGYKSHSDDRNFKITESTSAWDSASLLNNYVAVNRRNYQTVQDRGKTLYIYDGSNATWVDGGIWYRVEGKSQLNSEQLQSIANSL